MLKFRAEQIEAFRGAQLLRFESRAVAHLRGHLTGPTGPYTDEQLRLRVRACIARAKGYGLTSERQIMCFVDATFLLGERFDVDPAEAWAAALLRDPTLDADAKAVDLLDRSTSLYNDRTRG